MERRLYKAAPGVDLADIKFVGAYA